MKLTPTLAACALLAPSALFAQTRPRYEFGVDAAIAYYNRGDIEVGDQEFDGGSGFRIFTPVDVRIGFLAPGPLTFEPRVSMSFVSESDVGSSLNLSPTLNVLYQPGKTAILQRGMYFTGGVGLSLSRSNPDGDEIESSTVTQPSVNVGIGTRNSITQAAFRPEAFLSHAFSVDERPSITQLGVRLGLSFWR